MRSYLVTVTMPDGSQGEHHGLYACSIDAVIVALEVFPGALRVSARPLASVTALTWEAV